MSIACYKTECYWCGIAVMRFHGKEYEDHRPTCDACLVEKNPDKLPLRNQWARHTSGRVSLNDFLAKQEEFKKEKL